MSNEITAVIGASVNAEQVFQYNSGEHGGAKHTIHHMSFDFSGSGGNIAAAVKLMGGNPLVQGFVGINETGGDEPLRQAEARAQIRFKRFHILDQTSFSILPIDHAGRNPHVFALKGKVQGHMIDGVVEELRRTDIPAEAFVVVAGIRPGEEFYAVEMAKKAAPGRLILNFNYTFGGDPRLETLLSLPDMLIINRHEQELSGLSLYEFGMRGSQIVIVTDDEKGGEYLFRGKTGRFKAFKYNGGAKADTGAGDWFTGALVSWMTREGFLVDTLTEDAFETALVFAAKVAGKKVTMRGGSKGPSLDEL